MRTAHDAPSREDDAALTRKIAAHGLSAVTLELYLVYGPGQPKRDFPQNIKGGERPLTLSGAIKDFVWIGDVVEAYLLASHASGVEGLTIPIGTGQGRTEAEAAAILLRLMGSADAPPKADGSGAAIRRIRRSRAACFSGARASSSSKAWPASSRPVRTPDRAEERRQIPGLVLRAASRAAKKPTLPWSLVHRAAENFQKGTVLRWPRRRRLHLVAPGSAAGPVMKALLAAQPRQGGDRALARGRGPRGPEGWRVPCAA